jgi:hypothetical protein
MKFTNAMDGQQDIKEVGEEASITPIQGSAQKWKVSAEKQIMPNIFATRHCTPKHDKPYSKSHYSIAMAEVRKQEKDFTKEVDELLPETSALVKVCVEWHMCPTIRTDGVPCLDLV